MIWIILGAALLSACSAPALPPDVRAAWGVIRAKSGSTLALTASRSPYPVTVGDGWIAVSPDALDRILPADPDGRAAGIAFVLGHELGHDPREPDSIAEELRADLRAGRVMRQLGLPATSVDRLAPMLAGSSSTHGTQAQRLDAIRAGWRTG